MKMQRITTLLFFGMIWFIISCSTNIQKQYEPLYFPSAPDEPKIQFLTVINGSIDIKGKQSSFESFILGEETQADIIKPFGISSRKDNIMIVDSKLQCLININLKTGTFEYINPGGQGNLKKPLNCYFYNEAVYINDLENKQIVVLNNKNEFIKKIGSSYLSKPSDVAVCKEMIYISDMDSNKVIVFSNTEDKVLFSFPDADVKDTSFLHSPTNITVMNDKVYVVDFGEFNVKVFDLNGKFLNTIGSYGQNRGQFVRPKGVAVDSSDNVYVLDAAFENVQIFNSKADLLLFFAGPYQRPGYLSLPIKINIDYANIDYFDKYVDPNYNLKYLIYVTNQFGPDKITVYGFIEPKIPVK
jgi:DNA-binding beta-propeller fold protein YncE